MVAPANPFDRWIPAAHAYDAWYDTPSGEATLVAEVAELTPLLEDAPHPRIDLGTGTGRFGAAFGVIAGIDPAGAMLAVAATRLPSVIQGVAEALPLRSCSVGTVTSVATFEFLADLARPPEMSPPLMRVPGPTKVGGGGHHGEATQAHAGPDRAQAARGGAAAR